VVDSKGVEGLAIEIVAEPAVITALESEEGHHEEVGDGTVGEVIYKGNESGNGKDLLYRPRRSC
jgi:hypothetical protein